MRFQIYQINSDRDKNHIKFMGLQVIEKFQGTAELDPGIYDRVFMGDADCENLEDIYELFNTEGHC